MHAKPLALAFGAGLLLVCGLFIFSDYEIFEKDIDPEQREMVSYLRSQNIDFAKAVEYIQNMKEAGHGTLNDLHCHTIDELKEDGFSDTHLSVLKAARRGKHKHHACDERLVLQKEVVALQRKKEERELHKKVARLKHELGIAPDATVAPAHQSVGESTALKASKASLQNAEKTISSLKRTIDALKDKQGGSGNKQGGVDSASSAEVRGQDIYAVNCPLWPDTDEEYEAMSASERSKYDPKLRFIYANQNPPDCSKAKFMLYMQTTGTGVGAQLAPLGTLLLIAAAQKRILVPVFQQGERRSNSTQHTTAPYDFKILSGPQKGQPVPRLKGWKQAGCELQTTQCYWLPLTKCTLTEAEVTAPHTVMSRFAWSIQPEWDSVKNERIVEANPQFWGTYEWVHYPMAFKFLNMVPQVSLWPSQGVGKQDEGSPLMTGPGHTALRDLWAAATRSYLTRYNAKTKKALAHIIRGTLPADFNPDQTISMLLRGSDKCGTEGLCLPFSKYMEMAETIRKFDPTVDTIILTSEDPTYFLTVNEYPKWRFVMNGYDVKQGTGGMWSVDALTTGKYYDSSASQKLKELDAEVGGASKKDLLMYSMLSSSQLQLRGKYLILNCLSNWHRDVFSKVFFAGCGYTRTPFAFCVNNQVGDFRLCDSPRYPEFKKHKVYCEKQLKDWEDWLKELDKKNLGKGFSFKASLQRLSKMEANEHKMT